MAAQSADAFDYVIVGAGAAGCLLANRLTEDGTATVCVLEAGPPDRNPYIPHPRRLHQNAVRPVLHLAVSRRSPRSARAGRPISTTQGRTLGGGSSVNGMIYNRGQPTDFDSWAQRGNRGWGYADVLPYFRRTERRIGFGDDHRTGPGRRHPRDRHGLDQPGIGGRSSRAASPPGSPRNPDYNSGDQAGVGYFQRAIQKGRRVSAARAFLKPARARANLDVRTEARACAIILEGKRAVGIRYLHEPQRRAHARCGPIAR